MNRRSFLLGTSAAIAAASFPTIAAPVVADTAAADTLRYWEHIGNVGNFTITMEEWTTENLSMTLLGGMPTERVEWDLAKRPDLCIGDDFYIGGMIDGPCNNRRSGS